jgi:hypothetical protein
MRMKLTTAQASLAAGDYGQVFSFVEGCRFRELQGDVHSMQLLVRSSVANLTFGVGFADTNGSTITQTLTKMVTLGAANTWTLVTLPNLPVWPAGGQFSNAAGLFGYQFTIGLAAGSTYVTGSPDVWAANTVSKLGYPGQMNFAAQAVNSTFDVAFVQHEPGSECSTLIDMPFEQNLRSCQRYYSKSWQYPTAVGSPDGTASLNWPVYTSIQPYGVCRWPVTMWKAPASTALWSPATGAFNTVRDLNAAADRVVGVVAAVGDSGFLTCSLSGGNPAANWLMNFHYTADTGF